MTQSTLRPFKQISIDRADTHLAGTDPFVPYKSFDPTETAHRRGQPHGWLLARQQSAGLLIVRRMLAVREKPLTERRARDFLAATATSSAIYSLAENNVHRSNFKLPIKADTTGYRQTKTEAQDKMRDTFWQAQTVAERVVEALDTDAPMSERKRLPGFRSRFGHLAGEAAMQLACVELDVSSVAHTFDTQERVRNRVIDMIARAKETTAAMHGTPPSLAQFGEPKSPAVSYMYRHLGNTELPGRYEEALASIQAG